MSKQGSFELGKERPDSKKFGCLFLSWLLVMGVLIGLYHAGVTGPAFGIGWLIVGALMMFSGKKEESGYLILTLFIIFVVVLVVGFGSQP